MKEFIQGGKVTLQMSEDKHSRKSVHDETIMWTCKKIHPYTDIYVITKICAGIGRSLWQVYSCWHDLRTCLQVPTENRYFKCSKSSIFTDEKKIKLWIPYSCGVLHVLGGWERVRLNTVILCWFVYINACTHFSYNFKNSKASWF